MSLIEEALRRLQDSSRPTTEQVLPPAPPTHQPAPPSAAQAAPTRTTKPAPAPRAPRPAAAHPTPVHPWPTAAPSTAAPMPGSRTTSVLVGVVVTVLAFTVALLVGGAWWINRTLGGGTRPGSSRQAVKRSPAIARETGLSQPTTATQEPSHAPQTPPVPEPPRVQETRPVPVASDQAAPPTPEDHFVLSGLVEGEGEPYAVINGAIVAVGDRLGEFTLIDITNGAARLRRADGAETVLRVPR